LLEDALEITTSRPGMVHKSEPPSFVISSSIGGFSKFVHWQSQQ